MCACAVEYGYGCVANWYTWVHKVKLVPIAIGNRSYIATYI